MRRSSKRRIGVALALLTVAACDRGEPGHLPQTAAADVAVSAAVLAPAVHVLPGTVRSTDEAEVATRATGTIRSVRAEVGMTVRAGELLAAIDGTSAAAGVSSAAAEAERAAAYHRRIVSLARDGAATRQELDDARTRLETAEAALRGARGQIAYVEIRAPFDGVVSARHMDPGDLALPGVPIVTLVRPASLKVEADVPGAAAGFRPGVTATVRAGAEGDAIPARIARVSPAVDARSGRARLELDFAQGTDPLGLPPPGAFVRVEIPDPARRVLWIPADALVRRGQLDGVYRVEEGRLRLRWIRRGETRGDGVEILAGVGPGDLIVRAPQAGLADGTAVGEVARVEWAP